MRNALKIKPGSYTRGLLDGTVSEHEGVPGYFIIGDRRWPNTIWKQDCVRFVPTTKAGKEKVLFGICLRGNSKQRRQQRRMVERFLNAGRITNN